MPERPSSYAPALVAEYCEETGAPLFYYLPYNLHPGGMAMKEWKKRMGWTNLARERRLKLEEAARRRAHKAESDAYYRSNAYCKRRQKMLKLMAARAQWQRGRSEEGGRLCRADEDSESDAEPAPAMGH